MILALIFALVISTGWAQSELSSISITDAMSDAELRNYRIQKVSELQRRLRQNPHPTSPYRIFYCSIYYTPKESGFSRESGFDMKLKKAMGLQGKAYPRSFLDAVKMEGFGRLKEPVNGLHYIQYIGHGQYRFAKVPLGRRNQVLVPKKSCAISMKNPFLRQGMNLQIESPLVKEVFGNGSWQIIDTGGGVHPLQIDLYWGEDDPMGPVGRQMARPAGTKMEYAFEIQVAVE
jgi:hypothetical protein